MICGVCGSRVNRLGVCANWRWHGKACVVGWAVGATTVAAISGATGLRHGLLPTVSAPALRAWFRSSLVLWVGLRPLLDNGLRITLCGAWLTVGIVTGGVLEYWPMYIWSLGAVVGATWYAAGGTQK